MTRRALGSIVIVLGLLLGPVAVAPVEASTPQGAVTWKVDDTAKTITVSVKLQIYSACGNCPGAVNQFLADKMKKKILDVWNQNHQYRCYKLIFEVDISVGGDSRHVDNSRVGVRIDNSPVPIRSYVKGVSYQPDRWKSNDPADRVVPENDPDQPSTWAELENQARDRSGRPEHTYAHEFGHVMGLHDGYVDIKDPKTGEVVSVPRPGAPLDLMTDQREFISRETINRLVERSPVDRSKLKCDYTVVGSYREENSGYVCGGAVSPLMEDRVTLSLTWTEGGYEITEIKNVPTTFAPPKLPAPVRGVAVKMAPGFGSDPDILLAKDGSVGFADNTGIFSVRLTGDIHVGSCTFIDTKRGTSRIFDPGGTQATEVSFEFARDKFSGGKQTVPPRPYDYWTWVVTEK